MAKILNPDTKKECKGTGKAKGHGCGEDVAVINNGKPNIKIGLGISCKCWGVFLTTTEEGAKIMERAKIKGKKEVKKIERSKSREEKSLSWDWSKKLQTEVNSISRVIDKGLYCLARNVGGKMDAGHVYAKGENKTMKYNLHNIHRQSAHSNHWKNDDGALREGLINEYGPEYMEFIGDLRKTPKLTFNNSEYRELTNGARKILKQLKKDDRIYSKSERIEMRNRINYSLRIYDSMFCQFEN